MNITPNKNTKSDYRIANRMLPFNNNKKLILYLLQILIQKQIQIQTLVQIIITTMIIIPPLIITLLLTLNFKLTISPSLEDFTNTVSFTSINVQGINSLIKFKTIFEDLTGCSFSVINLQETKTKEISSQRIVTHSFQLNFS